MKRVVPVIGGVVFLLFAGAWLFWRFELRRLRSPESVVHETGLRLPDHARITATRAHLFSLVDANNFDWLVLSDISLLPWATANMQAETGGWAHIRQLSELGFPEEMPRDSQFGGVWRESRRSRGGREETAYLYLAADGRVGILSTFRP